MRYILTLICLVQFAFGQLTIKSNGMSIQSGNVAIHLTREGNHDLMYVFYRESINLKSLELYAGVGVHIGPRYSQNYKGDGSTAFLAGSACLFGTRYWFNKVGIGAEILPRVDFPFFGGCEMHKHCGEQAAHSSLTLSIKL